MVSKVSQEEPSLNGSSLHSWPYLMGKMAWQRLYYFHFWSNNTYYSGANTYLFRYTSIGSIYDTVPNALLSISDMSNKEENFKPAFMLSDGRLERAGRTKKSILKCESADVLSNGLNNVDLHQRSSLSASIIAVGDEIL